MKEKVKSINKIAKGIVLASALLFSNTAKAQDSWLNVQPATDLKTSSATIRFEGYKKFSDKLDLYGFTDFYATKKNPTSFNDVYLESRLRFSLQDINQGLSNFHLIPEVSIGTLENRLKLGLGWHSSLWKDNYTTVRFFPYTTSEAKGMHTTFFTMQNFMDKKMTASICADINLGSQDIYLEPELSYKLSDKFSIFAQGRSFGSINTLGKNLKETAPVLGIKYTF